MSRINELLEQEIAERASKAVDEFKAQVRYAIGAERTSESLEALFVRMRSELVECRRERDALLETSAAKSFGPKPRTVVELTFNLNCAGEPEPLAAAVRKACEAFTEVTDLGKVSR